MSPTVQTFTCPRCRRGEFRSAQGPGGKAFCPWCGDAVAAATPTSEPAADAPPLEQFSLEELAARLSGQPTAPVTATSAAPAMTPAPAAPPPSSGLEARLAESERRRELAEAELQRELDKKQGIKMAVLAEIARLEASVEEANARVRRKDEEHAAALETMGDLKHAKQQEWEGEQMRLRDTLEKTEKARHDLEAALEDAKKTSAIVQSDFGASRVEISKLHATVAAAEADRAELRQKLGAADAIVKKTKDAAAQLRDAQQKLQESLAKTATLQSEVDQRDKRIKELQLLVKTLGERLNQRHP